MLKAWLLTDGGHTLTIFRLGDHHGTGRLNARQFGKVLAILGSAWSEP